MFFKGWSMDIKINQATFPDIEYISIPKADGNGRAIFRNIEFKQNISGVDIDYEGDTIEYMPSQVSGDTLVIPNGHTLIEAGCEKSLSRYKTLLMI